VEEANAIYVNIGNASSRMCRILVQAETWCKEYAQLLTRCNVLPASEEGLADHSHFFVDITDLSKAVEAAKSEVSIDLEEAAKLRELLSKINAWRERVVLIAPKRSKRHSRAARSGYTVEDLVGLIEEAPHLPISTQEEVDRLQLQLSTVEMWRAQAVQLLEMIIPGFHQLHTFIDDVYGTPSAFSIERLLNGDDPEDEGNDAEVSARENNMKVTNPAVSRGRIKDEGVLWQVQKRTTFCRCKAPTPPTPPTWMSFVSLRNCMKTRMRL
jgi:hypothetical protein